MDRRGQIFVIFIAFSIIVTAGSYQSLQTNRISQLIHSSTKNNNLVLMTRIWKRQAQGLLIDFELTKNARFQVNILVIALQSLSERTMMLRQVYPDQERVKKIYQSELKFQSNSKAAHNYWLSYLVLAVLIASILLFLTINKKATTFKSNSESQRTLLKLFILCIMIKGCQSPCTKPANCQTCSGTSGSTCTLCNPNYYKVGNTCPHFTTITGCAGSNQVICVGCVNGYYLSAVNTCTTCSSVLTGCLRCVGSPALACSQCDFLYALNTTTYECDSCSFYLTSNCVTCITRYTCTTCVNNTLTVNAAGNCELCSVKKQGCYKCNSSVCHECNNGYYLLPVKFCTPCSTTLPACVICPSATVCTQCISSAYVIINSSCIICGAIYPFCATCNSVQCLSCESGFFLNVNLNCECMKGILIDNICVDVAGCEGAMKYMNSSFCTKCDLNIFYFNTTTVSCDCKSGFLLNGQCTLLYGCLAMYYVNNSQVCAMCNRTSHYSKNQTWCSCDRGYSLNPNDKSCYEICGDGILFDFQCDDGNNADIDGCSHSCKIERGFKCVGGGANSSSKCLNALENFELGVEEIEHMGKYDTGEFQFNILNFHPYFYILDLEKIFFLDIQQNHSISSITIRGSRVIFVVDYQEDLEGMPATLRLQLIPQYFQYPKTINITFSMISSTAPLRLASYPSAAILEILSLILKGISFLSLAILLFSSCYHKMIALETLTILQLCNLAPYLINENSIVLRVFDNLSYVNGYGRQLFQSETASEVYGETFEDMSLPKTFAEIMLINQSIIFGVAIFFVLAYWLRKVIFRFKILKEKFRYFVNVYCCNLVFSATMSLYLIFCLALVCNNHRVYEKTYKGGLYESTQSYKYISSLLNFLSIFIGQAMIVLVGFFNLVAYTVSQELLQKSQNLIIQLLSKQAKRLNVKSKSYVVVFLCNMFISFSILAGLFFFETKYRVYYYLAVSLPFTSYALIYRPYSSAADNFGLCLGQITSFIFLTGLCVKQYFWIAKASITLYFEFYLSMAVVALLVVFVITAVIRFFVACKFQRSRVDPLIIKETKKKKYTRFRVENDDEALLVDFKKPAHRLDPLKCQEFNHIENPDLLKLKDKLRNDLYEKRNMYRNVNPFREMQNPILETWLSDDGDHQ